MSVEAISWALNLAPVPADQGGQPSSACECVLAGQADHAGPDGTGAFPPVATLVRCTGLSERTVRTCLGRLAAGGHHLAVRPGHRRGPDQASRPPPARLGLDPDLVRHGLDDAALAVLEHHFPGQAARLAAAGQPGADGRPDGCTHRTPLLAAARLRITRPAGCSGCTRTVQGTVPGTRRPRARARGVRPQPALAAGWSVSSSPPWIVTGG